MSGSLTGAVASKGNGGARSSSAWLEITREECKGRRELDCERPSRTGAKAGLSDPAVPSGKGRRSTDKATPGITGLSPKSPHRRESRHLDVGSSHPGRKYCPKGWAVPIEAVRELGSERRDSSVPIRRRRRKLEGLSLVRDRDGQTAGVPVVPPGAPLGSHV